MFRLFVSVLLRNTAVNEIWPTACRPFRTRFSAGDSLELVFEAGEHFLEPFEH